MKSRFSSGDAPEGRAKLLPESLRKAFASGISGLFVTEEGIRNLLSDMRLPKDAMAYLVQQTERTRREMFRVVADELKGFLQSADLSAQVRKALKGMRVDIRAQVSFSDEDAQPKVRFAHHKSATGSSRLRGKSKK